ncbi:hypothetical protein BCD48_04615 [Pseudofrankia sp. BMG5.36]|nr:hypothetical protein BCD48_04615 [Pseudofrankia sp. BMG5.36]
MVSVDDHVVEPAHLFEGRLPARYREKAPRFVRRDDGTMSWLYGDQVITNVGLNAVAGRPPEEFGFERRASRRSGPAVMTSTAG